MEYRVGDNVVHPIHGVGRIAAIGKKRLTGEERTYYEVVTPKTTLWVPIDSSQAVGLRRLTPKLDLPSYRRVLKSRPLVLDDDRTKRRTELTERMKDSSFQALCEIVRDLTASGRRKPLGTADATLLKRAHDHLSEEWASADGITIAAASEEIDALILDSSRS